MNLLQIGVLAALFILIFGAVLVAGRLLTPRAVQERLDALADRPNNIKRDSAPWLARIVKLTTPLVKFSAEEGDVSAMRIRFITAGWRTPSAPALFFAAKSGLTLGLPIMAFFVVNQQYHGNADASTVLCWLAVAAAAGYYLPDMVLKRKIAIRQRDIFESFPDALDLMTVCVEAGLAMDAALARVGNEIGLKSLILAEELQLVTLELRAGAAKDRALRNLSMRTGVEDVDALVTMLIQAERFGTSVADSLRVQSDLLRTKRRQRAEEQAAKIALKLLFPLIFFIFPCLLVVLLGPAFLQIYRVLLPGMNGT